MAGFTLVSHAPRPPAETFAFIVDVTKWPAFRGYGPVPGITRASLVDGDAMRLGSRVRVENTDGSVHHEVVVGFEHGRHVAIRMELTPPASYVMARIEETVDLAPSGTGSEITRRFVAVPRSVLTAPFAWVLESFFLRRAVMAHNAAVETALSARV